MIYQRLSANAPAGERLLAFHLYGHPAIFVQGWDFGQEVDLVDVVLATPRAAGALLRTPEAGNPLLETV